MKILFIGTGIMGTPMCTNLKLGGFIVDAFNRTYKNAKSLEDIGINVLRHLPEILDYDIILSMVTDDDASRDVFFRTYKIIGKLKPKTVVIECSTLSPFYIKELEKEVLKKDCNLIDAPVSGSKPQAIDASLDFFVSGNPAVIASVKEIFNCIGKKVYQISEDVGTASKMKLINNILHAVQLVGLSEAIELALTCNIDISIFSSIISNGPNGNAMIRAKLSRFLNKDRDVQAKMLLLKKDTKYLSQLASSLDISIPMTENAKDQFYLACQQGYQDSDISEVNLQTHPLFQNFLKM